MSDGNDDRIYLFDTTLRDRAQVQGVDFTVADKLEIARELDELGIDHIEGGRPGANRTDDSCFENLPALAAARLVAFGMTRRPGRSAEIDRRLAPLLSSKAAAVCLVGASYIRPARWIVTDARRVDGLAQLLDISAAVSRRPVIRSRAPWSESGQGSAGNGRLVPVTAPGCLICP